MFCSNCGANVEDGSKYCPKCGRPLRGGGAPSASDGASSSVRADSPAAKPARSRYAAIGAIAAALVVAAVVIFVAATSREPEPVTASEASTQQSSASSSSSSSESSTQQDSAISASSGSDENADDAGESESTVGESTASGGARGDSDEIVAAFDANPSSVYCAASQVSEPLDLTGTIVVHEASPDMSEASPAGNVYLLELPSPLTVTGTQYGDQTNTLVALNGVSDTLLDYDGEVVTLNLCLSVRVTASIASAEYTYLQGSQVSVVRTFDGSDSPSDAVASEAVAPAADRDELAEQAGMALFTSGTYSDGSFTPTGCQAAEFLASGSAAASQYSDGWFPGEDVFAESAEVVSSSGDVYDVSVVFNRVFTGEYAARNGDLKVYIANVSLTFDENDEISDISGRVA